MTISKEELQAPIDVDTKKDPNAPQQNNAEEIQAKLKAVHTDAEQSSLKKIAITQELFEQIKKSLAETVKSMEKNPSIFSRAAEFWGELPLWQKILGGVALTVPTLIIGIAAHIGFLLALCGVTTVVYAGGGIILDDHNKCSISVIESLQKGILGLADLLELTINALEVIRKQLEIEIAKFAKENERLTTNINALSDQIDAVELQVRATAKINEFLDETKEGLNHAADSLKENVAQQTNFLQQNQQKLEHINEAYSNSQKELAEKIMEINTIKTELGDELNRAKLVIEALVATVSEFTAAVGDKEKDCEKILRDSLENKANVILIDRVHTAEQKLALAQKELESINESYRALLEKQGKHIDILVELRQKSQAEQSPKPEASVGQALSQSGFYAVKKEAAAPGAEKQEVATPQCS